MENEIFLEKSWNFDFMENIMEKSWKISHAKGLICHGKLFMSFLFQPIKMNEKQIQT